MSDRQVIDTKKQRKLAYTSLASERKLLYTTDTGLKIFSCDPCDNRVFNDLFANNEYSKAVQALVDSPYVGPRKIVDLGAHRGYFTLYCMNALRRFNQDYTFYCVEADPQNENELWERLLLQDGIDAGLKCGLVGKKEGKTTFLKQKGYHDCNMVCFEGAIYSGLEEIEYEYFNLNYFLPTVGDFDLVKVDIEGSEEDFFENYPEILKRTKLLVVEFHPNMCNVERCKTLLRNAGFNREEELNRKGIFLYSRV